MCLYPRLLQNPKYKPNKKNGGIVPPIPDVRVKVVPIGCGNCIECRKQKSREWLLRLMEDIKFHTNGKFVTLTFSNQAYTELKNEVQEQQFIKALDYETEKDPQRKKWAKKQANKARAKLEGYALDNAIATLAVRRFTERWRKKYKKAPRHWLITELGHEGTENIHLHGIIFGDVTELESLWKYGFIWKGKRKQSGTLQNYVSERTVKYITKYCTKIDHQHRAYKPIILCSKGIGAHYLKTNKSRENKFNDKETREYYKTPQGHKISLPIYWRNKLYTDEQKERLWINKIDKEKRYICGEEIDVSKGYQEYFEILKHYREKNDTLGYGNYIDWKREEYEHQIRLLKQKARSMPPAATAWGG